MKNKIYIGITILSLLICMGCKKTNQITPRVAVYGNRDTTMSASQNIGTSDLDDDMGVKNISNSKIGIAFGGGGAKAAAEIGVLKVIEEAGIKPEYIAGSSMGAVVGGLYAAGYSAKELDSLLLSEEWLSLFEKSEIGVVSSRFRTVFGLVKGDVFEERLSEALSKKGCKNIEDTKFQTGITFACTATNIVTKEDIAEKVLKEGNMNMAKAIRASMTYPAPVVGYNPVSFDGMLLVDGGMLNNLPVDVIKDMGAEQLIAIDLEKDRKSEHIISTNGLLKLGWLGNWLVNQPGNEKRNRNLDMANIKIQPPLSGYSILNFNEQDFKEMMELGEDEARTYHWKGLLELKSK